ncbi:hypothetical protein C8R45DRAFT_1209316 [Mycena sanguinolenta]|nr:hypothetical protein C8R45DRAFT_1209316 [Mycena sanguinolenta]
MAPRVQWREVDKAKLLQRLRWGKDNAFQAYSGWKPQIWNFCATDLKDSPGLEKTALKCKDQFQTIKGKFAELRVLCNLSGFGWDDGLKMVTASADVWQRYIEAHPDAARWQTTPFPLYDDMLYLVEGIIATGAGAFHAGAASAFQATPATSQAVSQATAVMTQAVSQSSQTGSAPSAPLTPTLPAIPQTPMRADLSLPGSDDLIASSPPAPAQKRAASSSPEKPTRRNRRPRNSEAGSDIASALRDVAGSLKVVGSPEARRRAIQQLEDDDDFSDHESATIMRLFTRDSAVAQTYTASTKKAIRTAYTRECLEEAERNGTI